MDCDVKDIDLAEQGAAAHRVGRPGDAGARPIRERFEKERPLAGLRIGACLHVTTETANLMRTLAAGGAEVALCASNPLSTQDDVAAALWRARTASTTFAIKGEDNETYYRHINAVLDTRPHITMDDGCDLVQPAAHASGATSSPSSRGDRGDHHRGDPPAGHGRGRASSPIRSSP